MWGEGAGLLRVGEEGAVAGLGEGPSWVVVVAEALGVCLPHLNPRPCPAATEKNRTMGIKGHFIQSPLGSNQLKTE